MAGAAVEGDAAGAGAAGDCASDLPPVSQHRAKARPGAVPDPPPVSDSPSGPFALPHSLSLSPALFAPSLVSALVLLAP